MTGVGAIVELLPDADLVRVARLARHGRGVTLGGTAGVAAQSPRSRGVRRAAACARLRGHQDHPLP
ncbi:hypothetical protein [Geodermatophilus sp. URMC 60]